MSWKTTNAQRAIANTEVLVWCYTRLWEYLVIKSKRRMLRWPVIFTSFGIWAQTNFWWAMTYCISGWPNQRRKTRAVITFRILPDWREWQPNICSLEDMLWRARRRSSCTKTEEWLPEIWACNENELISNLYQYGSHGLKYITVNGWSIMTTHYSEWKLPTRGLELLLYYCQ